MIKGHTSSAICSSACLLTFYLTCLHTVPYHTVLQEARESGLLVGHVKSRIILDSVTREEGRIDIMWATSLLCHNLEWCHPGQWTLWRQEDGWTCSEEGSLQGSWASRGTSCKEELHSDNMHGSCVLDPAGSRLFSKRGKWPHKACMPCSREHHVTVSDELCVQRWCSGQTAPSTIPILFPLCIVHSPNSSWFRDFFGWLYGATWGESKGLHSRRS